MGAPSGACHAPSPLEWSWACGRRQTGYGSKNGWLGQGTSKNIHADPDGSPLCVVGLFNRLRNLKPRFLQAVGTPLFAKTDGTVIHRDEVESTLRGAARRLDLPTDIFSTHSLRAGGATAMWACNYTVEQIQRRGRWASQCFRIYIWEGRESAVGLARNIFNTSVSMFAAMKAAANREERGRRPRT